MQPKFTKTQLKTLIDLGLSKTQSILYLTSLWYGILSALELSRLTKVNRQQIYEEAEKLVEMGLYDITRKRGRKYIPALPSKLLNLGKAKINKVEEVLGQLAEQIPFLEALSIPKRNKVAVRYYEGVDKIRKGYEAELEVSKNTEVLTFTGLIDHTFEFFPESYWDKWNKKLVKQKSRSRMLVHNSEIARSTAKFDKEYNRETRHLKHFPLKVNIDVFADVVFIVSLPDEFGVWLESPVLAESYRIIFNTLWELATPFYK